MNYKTQLRKEYEKVLQKLNQDDVSEQYLDKMLKVISEQLSKNENVNRNTRKQIIRNYEDLKEINERESIKQKAIKMLKQAWNLDTDLDFFQSQALEKRCYEALELIDKEDIEQQEQNFKSFLEGIISRKKRYARYVIDRIEYIPGGLTESEIKTLESLYNLWKEKENHTKQDLEKQLTKILLQVKNFDIELENEIEDQLPSEFLYWLEDVKLFQVDIQQAQEKLEQYFNLDNTTKTKPIKESKKSTYKQIVENIQRIDNTNSWDIPVNVEPYFWQALRNNYMDQSQINRARSIYKSGASIEESVKAIAKPRDYKGIEKLVRIQQNKSKQLLEAQQRLF